MSDDNLLKELNTAFLNYGAEIQPGEALNWRTYQVKVENDVSVVSNVKESVSKINENGEHFPYATPFCCPVITVLQRLEFIARYFCGEFEVQTKDKQFREIFAGIWYEFIKGWYFGTIYVGYGEDFEEIDKQKFIKDGKNFNLDGVPGKFRLFTRSGNGNGTFHSVLSGLSGLKFDHAQQNRLVKCESRGFLRWQHWVKIWVDWEEGMERFKAATRALSKNVVLTPKTEQEHSNIIKQFRNLKCFIKRDGNQVFGTDSTPQMGKTKFEEIIFMPRETPMVIFECISRQFESEAAKLGYAPAIPQQKKERINSGENFPHQKLVSNITSELLRQLNHLFDKMRWDFPEGAIPYDLKIVRANQAEAQGLPHMQFSGTFNKFGKPFNKFNNGFNKFNKYEDDMGND